MTPSSASFDELTKPLVDQFNAFCKEYGLVGVVQADHVCIKCSSSLVYESWRKNFEGTSSFIYQSIISKRRISVVGIASPIETVVGNIKYVELSDQKLDSSQTDCVDHIEIVPTTISYQELVTFLKSKNVEMGEVVRLHHSTYDIKLPSGFTIKLSREFLVDKIKREEMV